MSSSQIHLSKRLYAVASFVSRGVHLVDVGCDHCYIPIWLMQQEMVPHVLALDVREEPLARAKENISSYGFSPSQIEIRLSDGLKAYQKGEADSLLMSGIGGLLVCEILSYAQEMSYLDDFKELILSPHTDQGEVRRKLHELHFRIDCETMALDAGKYYTVIHAVHGEEQYDREEEYLYGKYLIEHPTQTFHAFIEKQLETKKELYQKILRTDTPRARRYAPQLEKELKGLRWILSKEEEEKEFEQAESEFLG